MMIPEKLMQNVGCDFNSSDASSSLDCLRRKSAVEVVEFQSSVADNQLNFFPFVPTVDGIFVGDSPKKLLESGQLRNVSVIIGSNANEGFWYVLKLFPCWVGHYGLMERALGSGD